MICLHIGTYKTGSKSLQRYLGSKREELAAIGRPMFTGRLRANNHIELYLSTMRASRDSLGKIALGINVDNDFVERTRADVGASGAKIYSTEGLSLLRYDDEVHALKALVGPATIVVVRRKRADFLDAYRAQIRKVKGRRPSKDPESALYIEDDAWIADHDALIKLYKRHFDDVRVVDYDAAVNQQGDVIPEVLRKMDLPLPVELGRHRLNARRGGWARMWNRIRAARSK